jgi:hypothetical protein
LDPRADVMRTTTINEHASGHLSATGSVKPTPDMRKVFEKYGITDVPPHGKGLRLEGPTGHHAEQRGIAHGENLKDRVVRQWSSSGAKHGGKSCTGCTGKQQAHGVDNRTGQQ